MNFLEFFQMREHPFGETPDTRFYYPAKGHDEALRKIRWALDENKSFLLVTGETGTGKTMISRLLHAAYPEAKIAMVVNPSGTPLHLLQMICREYGLPVHGDFGIALQMLEDWLLAAAAHGKRCILQIDEAHALSLDGLELVRMLTNLENRERKLLQVVLLGQTELADRMRKKNLRQLKQRVFLHVELETMDSEDTARYITHRIERAGGGNFVRFESAALRKVQAITGGSPRLINKICESALRFAFLHQKRHVTASDLARLPLRQLGVEKPKLFSINLRIQFR